mmetsp:Transcript_109226/g.348673  ORF Transcript_109226/g.348673 Transcript_109226/m.348673 type:complete len:214 (-) Transcript_109226:212-853(-)
MPAGSDKSCQFRDTTVSAAAPVPAPSAELLRTSWSRSASPLACARTAACEKLYSMEKSTPPSTTNATSEARTSTTGACTSSPTLGPNSDSTVKRRAPASMARATDEEAPPWLSVASTAGRPRRSQAASKALPESSPTSAPPAAPPSQCAEMRHGFTPARRQPQKATSCRARGTSRVSSSAPPLGTSRARHAAKRAAAASRSSRLSCWASPAEA